MCFVAKRVKFSAFFLTPAQLDFLAWKLKKEVNINGHQKKKKKTKLDLGAISFIKT